MWEIALALGLALALARALSNDQEREPHEEEQAQLMHDVEEIRISEEETLKMRPATYYPLTHQQTPPRDASSRHIL
jgi:hypothetical protein